MSGKSAVAAETSARAGIARSGWPRWARRHAWVSAAFAFALYLPSLRGGFVYDDHFQILSNRWMKSLQALPEIFGRGVWGFGGGPPSNYYRPLMHLANLFLFQAFGAVPWPFHLANILLHALATALVALLARELLAGPDRPASGPAALAAGLVFAAHPIHTEAVAWIGALPDLGGAAASLAAVLLYVRAARRGTSSRASFAASAALFLLGALFKETALLVPISLLAWEIALAPGASARVRLGRFAPLAAAWAIYLALRIHALGGLSLHVEGRGLGLGSLALSFPDLLARYVRKLFVPWPLDAYSQVSSPDSVWSAEVGIGLGVAVALAIAGGWAWRRDRVALVGILFFLIALGPAFYTPAIGGARFAERYVYLPSAGFALALASLLSRLPEGRLRAAMFAAACGVAVGVASVWTRLPVWENDLALWSDTARKEPKIAHVWYNLGRAQEAAGQFEPALASYGRALELEPQSADAATNAGAIYLREGDLTRAEPLVVRASELQPDSVEAEFNLGFLRFLEADFQQAEVALRRARLADPSACSTSVLLGHALVLSGRPTEALRCYREATAGGCGSAEVQLYRAFAEREEGDLVSAFADLAGGARQASELGEGFLHSPTLRPLVEHPRFGDFLRNFAASRSSLASSTK